VSTLFEPVLLAVDPGIRGCGAALFTVASKRLVACAYVKNPIRKGNDVQAALEMARAVLEWEKPIRPLDGPTHLVVEIPQMYTLKHQKGDQNDLLPLAAVDGALAALYQVPVTTYLPREWKGQIDKDATAARVTTRLDAAEHDRARRLRRCDVARPQHDRRGRDRPEVPWPVRAEEGVPDMSEARYTQDAVLGAVRDALLNRAGAVEERITEAMLDGGGGWVALKDDDILDYHREGNELVVKMTFTSLRIRPGDPFPSLPGRWALYEIPKLEHT
jgi:hypothetical protein